ncbi:MAG TPA: hypothetical protein VJV39_18450 [Dongiaceae bacterium]|nr:hypothetical protein [Dongiaceae bacterium]
MQQARERKLKVIIDGYDQIEVASIDSFPASDPPGWIEAAARPRIDEDVPADRGNPKPSNKAHRRVS